MDTDVDRSLPIATEPLPALTQEERTEAMRAVRLVKRGTLFAVRFRLHEQQGALKMDWSRDGGANVVTPNT